MNINDKSIIKTWTKMLIKVSKKHIFISAISNLLASISILLQAWIIADILNQSIIFNIDKGYLFYKFLILLIIFFLKSLMLYISDIYGYLATKKIKTYLRFSLFKNMMNRNSAWFSTHESGKLVNSIIDQVSNLDNFFSRYIQAMINAMVIPIAFIFILFFLDYKIGIILLVTVPLIPIFMVFIGYGTEKISQKQLDSLSKLSGIFADRLRGLSTLKLFGREHDEVEKIFLASETVRNNTMKVLKVAFLSSATLEFFSAIGIALVAIYIGFSYLGVLGYYKNDFDLRYGIFCLLIVPEIYNPLRQFAIYYHDKAIYNASLIELNKIFGHINITNLNRIIEDKKIQINSNNISNCKLEIKNFSILGNNSNTLLENINLTVFRGQHLAILGKSGIGKSSFLESIAKIKSYNGNIYIDNEDISNMQNDYLYNKLYMIGQKPFLFSGSLIDNIKIANINANKNEIMKAAELAFVTSFAKNLPNGMDTILGQNGKGISGGQAQRLAIARLFIRNPSLVLLDEPTSHLDEETEFNIINSILSFCKNKTLILVTHSENIAKRLPLIYSISNKSIKSI
ncbi:ATP-binding/permease protein CydD [Candidatus Kinetoplastibacterium sorsogonicusi]|uniref:ATP-binding/permease protein CydD n=1 Tax=Candidatus Kinetoplastidibacterium kentomonadis TaxID=1576550 RepID=A0A3Q8F402_9PROT|nr:thiol reductant ABC exporter subunit CydD [Candidatus Kinetoplastibacterium sorsogonicusi]AWD32722.1 ATP-binding/permease protein CydD [Candidatus Kinetoplastibacterium sorsogonicusi]